MLQWGWNPDSFAAVGTVGALCTSAWVILRDALLRHRKQAEHVVTWFARKTGSDQKDKGLFLYIRNKTTMPVYSVHVEYPKGSRDFPCIAPEETVEAGFDEVVKCTVEFSDATGRRRWRRSTDGGPPRRVWRGNV
jgi:hypothetical protein